jgi:6-phosphogluconolactonase
MTMIRPTLTGIAAVLVGVWAPAATSMQNLSAPTGLVVMADEITRVPFVYVSGYRPEIAIFRLDVASGSLTPAGKVSAGQNPSFLAWDAGAKLLFAANETDPGRVRSFAIDQANGQLKALNDVPAGGSITAHLSVDRSGKWLLVANYGDRKEGTIATFPIDAGGRLGAAVDTRNFGAASMPHLIITDPANRFVFVPCKGGPFVAQLRLDAATGRLSPNNPERVASAPGSGPRHMDFHPNRKFAYVINELDLTMSAYAYDSDAGLLRELQTLPTLPKGAATTDNSAADVHVHPSGNFLYGSNRGHNSIVIYRLDPSTGRMTLLGHETRAIKRPRNFHIDPSGSLMLVANQDDASVTVFRIDQNRGTLDQLGAPVPVGANPSFVGVVMLPGR